MRRESHVRFWEGGGVQVPSATRLIDRVEFEPRVADLRARIAQLRNIAMLWPLPPRPDAT